MKKCILLILSAALIGVSCKKNGNDGPQGPTGPAGPAYKGSIKGYVSIYDQYGNITSLSPTGIQLTLSNGRTVTPDSTGLFLFDSVNTGTYSISASGPVIASTVVNNVSFVKDTLYKEIALSQPASFTFTSFTAYHNPGSPNDSLIAFLPSDLNQRACLVFVGTTPDVSSTNFKLAYKRPILPGYGGLFFRVPYTYLNNVGIFYGETVYYAIYPYVVNDYSAYIDFNNGKSIFSAVGTPVTDSTIAP